MSGHAFQESQAHAFLRSLAQARNENFLYTSFRIVQSFWPHCGFCAFDTTDLTNTLIWTATYKGEWPKVFSRRVESWYFPAYRAVPAGLIPAKSGSQTIDATPMNTGNMPSFWDVSGFAWPTAANPTTTNQGDAKFASPYDPPDSLEKSDTFVRSTWTIYNEDDGSPAGTAWHQVELSNPVNYAASVASAEALLSGVDFSPPDQFHDGRCRIVWPSASGVVVNDAGPHSLPNYQRFWIGVAARGMAFFSQAAPQQFVATGGTVANYVWPAAGGPIGGDIGTTMSIRFVSCMKSEWRLLPINPATSGLFPPSDNSPVFWTGIPDDVSNLYLMAITHGVDGLLSVNAPAFFRKLNLPRKLQFGPADVPGYGEIGFRSSLV